MNAHRSIPLRIALALVTVAGFLSFAPPLVAQTDPPVWCGPPVPPCDPNDPTSQCYKPPPPDPKCEPKECDKCTKSPCYVGSGVYETGAQDFAIPTTGFPLVVSRKYQSTQAIDGPLGFGWTSSVAAHLYYATYLFAAPSTYQKIAYVIMPNGARYRFADNGNGTFSPPAGRHDSLIQNADGTFDLRLQRTRSVLHFNALGGLASMTDSYGNALTISYDGNGRVQRIADSAGSSRYIDVFWGSDGRVSAVRDSASRQVQYVYNAQGGLASVTDPASRITSYSYVTGRFAPLLSQIKDNWNRIASAITYDTSDRVKTYTDKGETYTYTYAYQGIAARTAKVDSQGNTFIYPFGSAGLVSDTLPPAGAGNATHTDYYPDGTVQQFIDGAGVKTYYTYTPDGSLLTVTRDYQGATAVRFEYTYDPAFPGRVIAVTPKNPASNIFDANWQASQYDYYQLGDPAPGALHHAYRIRTDGVSRDTMATYEYDAHGRLTREIDAAGYATDYGYDPQGNLSSITTAANNDSGVRPITAYGHDSLGRLTSVTDPLGHVTTYAYDTLGRPSSMTLPKPSTGSSLNFTTLYSYDNFDSATGLLSTAATDPNGNVVRQSYDQFNQMARFTDTLGRVTNYTYSRGLLTSETDPNGYATSYAYDPVGRITATTFPDGSSEHFSYTSQGLRYQVVDRQNRTTTFGYDAMRRMTQKTFSSGKTIAYSYSGTRLTQIVDSTVIPTETDLYSYDSAYRLASNTQGGRGTVTYLYDVADRRTNYSVQSGPSATYTYYPNGSVNTIAWSPVVGSFKYAYTLSGLYQSVAFPNSQTRNFSYDDQGRLTQLTNLAGGGGTIASYVYGYDFNYRTGGNTMLGQRVSMSATVPSQSLTNQLSKYEYDGAYELNKVSYPSAAPFNGEVDAWTYDAIGNRLTANIGGSVLTYQYQRIGSNSNNWTRLLGDGSNTYSYDANGNTTGIAGAGLTLTWDERSRLTALAGTATATYGYDAAGRRATATEAGGTTTYLYLGKNPIRTQGAVAADFLFGPGSDEPLAVYQAGSVYYYAISGEGSVAAITDSTATVRHSYLYDVWGAVRQETGTVANPFGFTGREFSSAGLYYFRARWLKPQLGRFLSEDPLDRYSRIFGRNHYLYAGLSPVMNVDPSGLVCTTLTTTGPPQPILTLLPEIGDWYLWGEDLTDPHEGPGGFGAPWYVLTCLWERVVTVRTLYRRHVEVTTHCECPPRTAHYHAEQEFWDVDRQKQRTTTRVIEIAETNDCEDIPPGDEDGGPPRLPGRPHPPAPPPPPFL